MRVYNFSAGPSMLPIEVLNTAKNEMLSYGDSGMSVSEMSHRSKVYESIHNETISLFREVMNISDDYYILLLQGGASMQFEAVPLNLLVKGRADYVVTGNFASNAYKQAKKYGDIALAASSQDKNHTYIPKLDPSSFREDIDYVHITSNNTIFGTKYNAFPEANAPIVCDMSSNILSEEMDISKLDLIYAGAQKNIAPAGLTVVIVKKDLVGKAMDICPTMLKYDIHAEANSLYNTCPCFPIYMAGLNLKWLKSIGGVKAISKINYEKATLIYDFIDNSDFYVNPVVKSDRSIMNIPFTTPNADLDASFVKGAEKEGLISLKGHRLVGGMRASIYNAMPIEGVVSLVEYMQRFELNNKNA